MQTLHVGSGTTHGALTVFPIWGEHATLPRHTTRMAHVRVAEQAGGPSVGNLVMTNLAAHPALVFEGQVLEGGWQTRMLTRSMLLPANAETPVDVVCVEAGRWEGSRTHRSMGRRASTRVRAGLRAQRPQPGQASPDRQQEVWRRVSEYDARFGANATSSFAVHADRAADEVGRLVHGLKALPGQIGVMVAIGGQPVFTEVFGTSMTLHREFDSIVRAAALDALGAEPIATPSRRARRFLDRAARLPIAAVAPAGIGMELRARDDYVDLHGLGWNGRAAHLVLANPRHALAGA